MTRGATDRLRAQQNRATQADRVGRWEWLSLTPELGEHLGLDGDVLDKLRVGRRLDGRDHLAQRQRQSVHLLRPAGPDAEGLDGGVEVAWRGVPLLALAAVHWQLDGVARRQLERLVDVQQRLMMQRTAIIDRNPGSVSSAKSRGESS